MQIHSRAKDDITTVFLGLITDSLTDFPDKFCVPCGGQTAADGKGCGIIGLVGSLSSGVDTYAGRAVGEDCGWDSETWNGRRRTSGTGYEVGFTANDGPCAEEVVCTANKKLGFFFKSHGLEHLVDVRSR